MINLKNKARHSSFFQKIGLTITLALIVQCSPALAQNSGVLCVYRESARRGGLVKANILATGKEIATLKSNSSEYVKLNSGDYALQCGKDKKSRIFVSIKTNDTLFVKVELKFYGTYSSFFLSEMDKRQGKIESLLIKEMEK